MYSSGSSICGAEEKWRTEELSTDDDEIDDDDDDDDDERAAAGVIVVAATALFIVATALAARRQIIEDNILFVWFVLYERWQEEGERLSGQQVVCSVSSFVFVLIDTAVRLSEPQKESSEELSLLLMRGCNGRQYNGGDITMCDVDP